MHKIGDNPAPGLPKGQRPIQIGTTQAGSVEVWQQDIEQHTPSGNDVAARVAAVPPFVRSPVQQTFDAAAKDVGANVAASFLTGSPIDHAAVTDAFHTAMSGAKGK
jgi:hypothetical protein